MENGCTPNTPFITALCPTNFFEFDIYDKDAASFLELATRLKMVEGTGIHTVPVLHCGAATAERLPVLLGPSAFDSVFDNPRLKRVDNLMEGLYFRTENQGVVTGRAKMVRPSLWKSCNRASIGNIKPWSRINWPKEPIFGPEV
jgi:hypothetical protein